MSGGGQQRQGRDSGAAMICASIWRSSLKMRSSATETEVKIRRLESCATCHGSGSSSGRGPSVCPQCQGRGQIRYQQGFFSVARTCSACGGTGRSSDDPCATCRGETRVAERGQAECEGAAGR